MTTLVSNVQKAIEDAGIPVLLMEIGRPGMRSTWVATLPPNATPEQKKQARAIIDNFDASSVKAPRIVDFAEFIDRLTNAEWSALKVETGKSVPLDRWFEVAKARGTVNLEDAKDKASLNALVTAGVFTAKRLAAMLRRSL